MRKYPHIDTLLAYNSGLRSIAALIDKAADAEARAQSAREYAALCAKQRDEALAEIDANIRRDLAKAIRDAYPRKARMVPRGDNTAVVLPRKPKAKRDVA